MAAKLLNIMAGPDRRSERECRERSRMQKIFWRSLRSRILLLVVLTFVFLTAAAISLFTFLRNRHAETLSLTEHHLVGVAASLAQNYADHRTVDNSLREIEPGPPHPPAPPSPYHPGAEGPPPPKPDLLKGLTAETLQHEGWHRGRLLRSQGRCANRIRLSHP